MLISIKELKEIKEFENIPNKTLERKIKAIEQTIRQVTSNNFQNRLKRIVASSSDNKLNGVCPYFKVGDTIQISESINNGLYVIKEMNEANIVFDEDIFDSDNNLATKVEYPIDVIEGAIELLKWEVDPNSTKNKVGIASETISRHSVSYDNNSDNVTSGYPTKLLNFCKKYEKARF